MPTNETKYMNDYMKKYRERAETVKCEVCKKEYKSCYKTIHNKTKYHMNAKTSIPVSDASVMKQEIAELKAQLKLLTTV